MLVTTLTKLYLVNQALLGGLFVFLVVDQISQVLFLGGIDCHRGGNRYQSHTLIWEFPSQPSKTELF